MLPRLGLLARRCILVFLLGLLSLVLCRRSGALSLLLVFLSSWSAPLDATSSGSDRPLPASPPLGIGWSRRSTKLACVAVVFGASAPVTVLPSYEPATSYPLSRRQGRSVLHRCYIQGDEGQDGPV